MNAYRPELQAIALILGISLLAALGAVVASASPGPSLSAPPTIVPTVYSVPATPLPSIVAGPLDGMPTRRVIATRRPLAVVMDNFYPDARPQSGIGQASVVFDALTEGGITRLMALYLEKDVGRVGPIRSARPYFVSWAAGFGALFVHAGGSPAALQFLRRTPALLDIDASKSSAGFSRASDRVTPHNLYANVHALRSNLTGPVPGDVASHGSLTFGNAAARAERGRGQSIFLSFSTAQQVSPPEYAVSYRYVRSRNVYARSQGGVAFIDRSTGQQVAPHNVIVMVERAALIPNDPLGRISIGVVGSGRATIFENGRVIFGKWFKASVTSALAFTRTDGRPVRLVPGQTWIEVVPPGGLTIGSTQ